jgi:hypothetical protein
MLEQQADSYAMMGRYRLRFGHQDRYLHQGHYLALMPETRSPATAVTAIRKGMGY